LWRKGVREEVSQSSTDINVVVLSLFANAVCQIVDHDVLNIWLGWISLT